MKRFGPPMLSLLAGILCVLVTAQDVSPMAGNWESAGYYVTLQVDGSAVTGTFRRYVGNEVIRGTITGTVDASGRSFEATFSQKIDGETETFTANLTLARHGKALNGFQWGLGDQQMPSVFALWRTESTKRGVFFDEDTVDEGKDPPVPPPTNDPRLPVDEEEPLKIQPRPEPTTAATALEPRAELVWDQAVTLFDNSNTVGVQNGPSQPTVFSLDRPHGIALVRTYHWNSGKGATPGTLALRGADGAVYGPWQARGAGDQQRSNIMWVVEPKIVVPAGQYTVVDSDPSTWGANSASGGRGFAWVNGVPADDFAGEAMLLFTNSNSDGLRGIATQPTRFTLDTPHRVTMLRTYHHNGGKGATPGTLTLVSDAGVAYGPWDAAGVGDKAGRQNLFWQVEPHIDLPAGNYTILDSDPSTWGANDGSGKAGFAWVWGWAL
ncbi:MAG: hypothetical protein HPY44_07130 [Armatimonadetes bacterium]|nr:hypothetical protein [Armatimonadota bacterium]